MKAVRIWLFVVPAVLGLLIPALSVSGQPPVENDTKPAFTAEQKKALNALYEHGGILIHLDERRPGQPVVMVDFASHPEFSDDWLKHLLPFPELTVVRLAGTAITDAGLDQLAKIPKLTYLDVQGTQVTPAGVAALRKSLPRLELAVEPEKLVAVDLPVQPPTKVNPKKESVLARGGTAPPTAGAGVVKRFTAQEITQWRKQLTELGYLPEGTPNGWSKSRVDPAKMLTVFPELKVRQGYVLRAYVFKEDANANGFVCALPADADFPEPDDCPRLESHFLNPPKPLDALDDIMEVIEGDDSPESYLHASILRRELREFGGGWHGIQWGMNTVLDASPWERIPSAGDEPATDRPTSKPHVWKWRSPQPETWSPEVRMDQNQVVVTFYSYTPLSRDLGNGEVEKERIIHHTDTYRRGKYRPLVVEKKLAEGPNAVVF